MEVAERFELLLESVPQFDEVGDVTATTLGVVVKEDVRDILDMYGGLVVVLEHDTTSLLILAYSDLEYGKNVKTWVYGNLK